MSLWPVKIRTNHSPLRRSSFSKAPTTEQSDDEGIGFTLAYHGGAGVIRGGTIRRLVVRVDLPDGLHIYDEPVPAGMVATSFTLSGPDGIRSLAVEKPPTEPLELPGVGKLQVWSGQIDFAIPVWATDKIASLVRDDNPDHVTIELDVAYQACDDQACRLPQSTRLSLDVPIEPCVGPALAIGDMPGAETTSMDTMKWLGEMISRGLESTPDPDAAVAYLQQTIENYNAGPLGEGRSED